MATPTPLPDELHGLFERFDHLALAVGDIRSVVPLLTLMGGVYRNGGRHPTAGFRWVQFTMPGGSKIELLTPVDPSDADHFLNRFLEERGEGPHHVTFKVRDIQRAVGKVRDLGYEVVGENFDHPGWKEAFVHPKTSHGLLVQIAQWDDEAPGTHRTLEDVLDADDLG